MWETLKHIKQQPYFTGFSWIQPFYLISKINYDSGEPKIIRSSICLVKFLEAVAHLIPGLKIHQCDEDQKQLDSHAG